jgi:hypothetical protein
MDLSRASNAENRQKPPGPSGCVESSLRESPSNFGFLHFQGQNGLPPALLVAYRSIADMLAPRALAAGHFERNKHKGI